MATIVSSAKALTILEVEAMVRRPDGRAVMRFASLERGAIAFEVNRSSAVMIRRALAEVERYLRKRAP
jgi:hypothetical protein